MSVRRFVLLLVCIAAAASVSAREISQASPEKLGFSVARFAKVTEFMNAEVQQGTMIGGMGLIARDGKIVYQQTYGMADREAGRLMEEDAIFRIYSMTKPITGVALMMLFEEGKFKLSDPVAMYLPELANLQVALSTAETGSTSNGIVTRSHGQTDESLIGQTRQPARQPTIRDLMLHTAGFTYGVFGDTEVDRLYNQLRAKGDMSLEQYVIELGKLPLQYEPGAKWHYSISVDIQGRLIEVLSGMKFSDFLQQRIFAPLDMADTSFVVPVEKRPRLAQLYQPKGNVGADFLAMTRSAELEVASPWISAGYFGMNEFESGGAGLVSTMRDYLRFTQLLLNEGELDGVRILAPKTVQLMTANHVAHLPVPYGTQGYGYGLGFGIHVDPGALGIIGSPGEYSWGGAAGTRFWVDPVEGVIGIFMSQTLPNRMRLADHFKVLTYAAMTESRVSP